MLAASGLFFPIEMLPPPWQALAGILPVTHAVALLSGIWKGAAWSQHYANVAALALNFLVCTAVSAKVFRWE
jgi:ABC-2 type transport system permease protein